MSKIYNTNKAISLRDIIIANSMIYFLFKSCQCIKAKLFNIITMTLNPKPKASFKEVIAFYLCGSIGLAAVTRNIVRMYRYQKAFKEVTKSLERYRHNFGEIENIKNSNTKDMALLETVFPTFPNNYFQNTQDPSKYRTNVGKFYQQLQVNSGFQGSLRHKGKEYLIYFEMEKASVGFQIAKNALKFDQKGIKFHRNQMIAVFGQLSYSKDDKKYKMKTKFLGLDTTQIIKFCQLKLVATIISTFYFSMLLGVSINIWFKLENLQPSSIFL